MFVYHFHNTILWSFSPSKIADVNKMDSIIFPASVDNNNNMSPFYSTGNSVSIKLIKPSLLKGLRLKAQKVNKIITFFASFMC